MNKKILSFVLAMVLSFGLGFSNLVYAAENSTGSDGTNSGVMSTAGQRVITAADRWIERISQTFNYEHGVLTYVTAADGSITLYDRGQYRMTLKLGLSGEYEVSDLQAYGTDVDEIEKCEGANWAEKFDNWQRKWGVTESQLMGGSKADSRVEITKDQYKDGEKIDKKKGEDNYIEAEVTQYYKKVIKDGKETEEEITEDEYKTAMKNNSKDSDYREETKTKYYKITPGNDAYHVKWNDPKSGNTKVKDHLTLSSEEVKMGINKSIRISYGATNGASITLITNGKAYETYAYDGELISYNEYYVKDGVNGVRSYQAEMDLVQKKDENGKGTGEVISTTRDYPKAKEYANNEKNYVKAWSFTDTYGGKVISCCQIDPETGKKGPELREYQYGLDGQLKRVLDFVNGTVTIYNPTATITLSALDQNIELSNITDAKLDNLINKAVTAAGVNKNVETSEGFYISQVQVLNADGTIDYSISRDDSGKTTTTAYVHNIAVQSGNGVLSSSYLKKGYYAKLDYIMHGGDENSLEGYPDLTDTYLTNDQLAAIKASAEVEVKQEEKTVNGKTVKTTTDARTKNKNGNYTNGALERLVRVMGWDNTAQNRADAWDLINEALNFSGGAASQGLSFTYADTTYTQDAINDLKDKNGVTSNKNIVSNRFVKSVTVMHHNARYMTLNFADHDSSLSRAAYITAASTFSSNMMTKDGKNGEEGNGVCNLTETTSIADYEKAMNSISSKLEAAVEKARAKVSAIKVTTGGNDSTKAAAVKELRDTVNAKIESELTAINTKFFKKGKGKIKFTYENNKGENQYFIQWSDSGDKERDEQYNGVFEKKGQKTHKVNTKKGDYIVSLDAFNLTNAFGDLKKSLSDYITEFGSTVRAGDTAILSGYDDRTFNPKFKLSYSSTYVQYYKLVDPMGRGKSIVSDDGNTLTFGAGTRVNLFDGNPSYTLQEGEELVVDISGLDAKTKAELIAAANAGEEVMVLFDITGVDKKNGRVYGKANSDYVNGGTANADKMKEIEDAIADAGGNIEILRKHYEENSEKLKGFTGTWIEGCDILYANF